MKQLVILFLMSKFIKRLVAPNLIALAQPCQQHHSIAMDLEWYAIRELLLGDNDAQADVKRALELADSSQHPEARWLCSIVVGKDVTTKEEARAVFLQHGDDPRALCFSALLADPIDEPRLKRSAELGYAFGEASYSALSSALAGKVSFGFASKAGAAGERLGFYMMGYHCHGGDGCEADWNKAREHYRRASELGLLRAMVEYSKVDESDLV